MGFELTSIFSGVPVSGSSRGPLGWSSVLLIRVTGPQGTTVRHYLFDTGGHNERPALIRKLGEHGLGPADIDGVILSHLHFDHAANWMLFPDATIYIHRYELDPPEAFDDFAVPDFHRERLAGCQRLQLVGEGDSVDGLNVLEAPGHTQGLIALELDGHVLASDAIKNRAELSPQHPLSNTWKCDVARRSIDRLSRLARKKIYPGHDVPLVRHGEGWVAAHAVSERITVSPGVAARPNPQPFELQIERS